MLTTGGRYSEADWFKIVGVVARREQIPFRVLEFALEVGNSKVKDFGGDLFFFANDLEDRYDNNLGFIQVRVFRKK